MALSRDQLQQFNSQRPQQGGNAPQQGRPRGALQSALASGQQSPDDGGFFDTVQDVGIDLAQGALRLPGAAAGLADIPTALAGQGAPISAATSAIGEATGFQPGEWADSLEQYQSDALQQSQGNVSEAFEGTQTAFTEGRYGDALRGAGRGALALATNPRALVSTVTESLPLMLAGGAIGKGLSAASGMRAAAPTLQRLQQVTAPAAQQVGRAVATGQAGRTAGQIARTIPQRSRLNPIVAAGAGEGAVIGGMQMDELLDNPDVDPQIAALASLAAGAGGAALGVGGGALAQRLGVINPEQAVMGAAGRNAAAGPVRNLPARVAGGFVSEGLFEEMPQETLETVTSNWAEGEPLLNNVPRAMVEGMMAGGVMGGAFGLARPRDPNALPEPTNLTDRTPGTPVEPSGPQRFNTPEAAVPNLLRYHRRLARVATEATQYPDLQDEALNRMDTVLQELDNRGIPREIVEKETAKQRYKETALSLEQMQNKYRQSLRTNPEQARGYLEKARNQARELQQLEEVYGAEELQSPDLATIQTLQNVEGTENYFRKNGSMRRSAQRKLDQYLDAPEESLARAVQNDLINEENGAEPADNYAPMRRVVAEQRGLTPERIEQVAQADAGAELRQQRESRQGRPANVTNAEDIRTDEQGRAAVEQFDDEPVDPREQVRQRFRKSMESMSPERKRVWDATQVVAQEAGSLGAVRNIAERVGQLTGKTPENVKNTFAQMRKKLEKDLGVQNSTGLTMNQFLDLVLSAQQADIGTTQQGPEAEAAGSQGDTVESQLDEEGNIIATEGTPNLDPTDDTETDSSLDRRELLGLGGAGVLNSAGGSQGQVDPVIARALDNDDPRASEEYRALTSNATRALREFERDLTTAQREVVADHAEAQTQLQEAVDAGADAQDIEALQARVDDLYEQLPASQKRAQEMAELQRQEEEAGQAAAQRRAERQAEAEQQLSTAMGEAAGAAWDKRANPDNPKAVAIWPSTAPPPTWAELVETDPLTAYAWLETLLEIRNERKERQMDAMRRAFVDTVREIENDRRTEEVTGQPRYTGPDPVQRGATGQTGGSTDQGASRTGQSTAQATRDGDAQVSEPGVIEQQIEEAAAQTEPAPSEAQAESGNYRKGKFRMHGFEIAIENPRGSVRRGRDENGNEWESEIFHHYGDVKGTTAADGDNLDVFIGPNPDSPTIYVIDQNNEDGSFDEHKVMMGFESTREAIDGYNANYEPGWDRIRSVTSMTTGQFKDWARNGDMKAPAAEADLDADPAGLQARRERVGQTMQELYVQSPSPELAQAMVALSRASEADLPGALADAEALIDARGGAAPSTQATEEAPTPVVRRRGRRQRVDASTLRPAQATTFDAVEEAQQAASDPNAGPEAKEQLHILLHNATEQRGEALGIVPGSEQAQLVRDASWELLGVGSDVQRALDIASSLAGNNTGLQAVIEQLRSHPSIQNVRFLSSPAADAEGALGHYYEDLHAIYINETAYSEYADHVESGFYHPSIRIDQRLAETVVHELVHAASLRYMSENREDVYARLSDPTNEIIQYVNSNRAKFSDEEFSLLEVMLSDPAEIITYTLTSKPMQRILARIPSSRAPNRNMLGRLVDAIMSMLGLEQHSGTMLETMADAANSIFELDAAHTRQQFENVRNTPQDTWDLRVRETAQNLNRMQSAGWDLDEFEAALFTHATAADKATMAGDTEARVRALDGLSRVMTAVRKQAANVEQAPNPLYQLKPLNQAAVSDRLASRVYDSALSRAPKPMQNWLTALKNGIRRLPHPAMFSHDFVDYVKQTSAEFGGLVETYFSSVFHRLSERNNHHVAIQKIVDPVSRFTAQQREQMNDVLRTSAYSEQWAFQPDWIGQQVPVDAALARKFDALPEQAQSVVREMFKYAYTSNRQVQRQLRADIVTSFDALIDKAKRDKQKDKLRKDKATALAEHDARQIDRTTPYLPLKRWGNWAVVHKSARFKQAEIAKNRKEVNKLKADPQHYQVVFAENEFQALQERDRMSEELGVQVSAPFQRMRYEQSNEAIPFDLLQRLRTEAMGDKDPASMNAVEKRISSAIDRLYIEALEESSVRKSELRRLKVEGAGRDMVRAFVEHGQGLAALSSAMQLNKETRKVVQQMKSVATDPTNIKDRPRRMEALNEVLARHALAIDLDTRDTLQQKVMGYTSIWMLLTSPAYYIQNATQPFMLTLPVLSARFGINKSMGFMRKAYKEIFEAKRATGGDDLIDPMKLADPNEQELFTRLQRLNLLDVGIAADLGSIRNSKGPVGRTLQETHRKMLVAVRTVEVYNRGVSAIAGYRLMKQHLQDERDAGRNSKTDSAIVEDAKKYAMKIIQTTQGDYSGPNAPRLIEMLPAGRLLTQFRKFQLIQIGLLARTVNQMFRGSSAAEKTIGRRQMAYILGMHGMIGGAMGLPAANIIGYALAQAFGDDDEPANAELLARRAIGNKEVADLILKGLPTTFGVDASNRLGMGLTFSVMPFADISASRDGFYTMLGNLLGPTVGLGAQFADGMGQIQQGNVGMGMSQLMPSLLKNTIRAYMYTTDGVRLRNGDLAMSAEELSWFDVGTQGLGWPSQTITDRYFGTGALRDVQEHFRSRTTKIKKAYVSAFETGDAEAMQTAREQWMDLQTMRRKYRVGDPQPLGNLLKAPREQTERERLMVEGVPTQRTTRRFVEELFE